MKASIAEVNVTSPERIMCGHFLLCYNHFFTPKMLPSLLQSTLLFH